VFVTHDFDLFSKFRCGEKYFLIRRPISDPTSPVKEGISLSTSRSVEIGIHCGWVLERDRAAINAVLDDHMEVELAVTRKSNRTATR